VGRKGRIERVLGMSKRYEWGERVKERHLALRHTLSPEQRMTRYQLEQTVKANKARHWEDN